MATYIKAQCGECEPTLISCCGIPEDGCNLTAVFVDENRCEDDNFDFYLVRSDGSEQYIANVNLVSSPPGCCGEDYCPETRREFPFTIYPSDVRDEECNIALSLRFVSPNCCGTYANFNLVGSSGAQLASQYFGSEGLDQNFSATDLCNPAP